LAAGSASVTVLLENSIDAVSGFSIRHSTEAIALASPVADGCETNFDAWGDLADFVTSPAGVGVEQWPAAVEIFQNIGRAIRLAPYIGLDESELFPFEVQAWCPEDVEGCGGMQDGAFFVQGSERPDAHTPMIAIIGSQSELMASGVPDNREYHEFGHLVQAVMTGSGLPLSSLDVNHGGYFRNPTSTDSMVEGFGEFLSMMVSKHVDGDPYFEMYRIGAEYDLEMDRLPWELEGWWEEFTVAGVLLDLEDGDGDYGMRALPVGGLTVLEVRTDLQPGGTLVIGQVENSGGTVVNGARVTVEYLDAGGVVLDTQVARVVPARIAPGHRGEFYAVPSASLEFVSVVARSGGVARPDDDSVDVELRDLLSVMFSFEQVDGGRGVVTVHDLYLALSAAAGDAAVGFAGVTQDQVDTIFISHGFFEDLDGNQSYDASVDGQIGMSSHFSDGPDGEITSRWDPKDFDKSRVTIDTGGLADEAVIQIAIPGEGGTSGYSFTSGLLGDGSVVLPVPPSGREAEMSVVALGDGLRPSIAFRLSADEFHERLESGSLDGLTLAVVEVTDAAALETRPATGPTSRGLAGWMMMAGAGLVGAISVGILLIFRKLG